MSIKSQIVDAFDGNVQFRLGDKYANEREYIDIHDREYLGLTGSLAVRLVEQYGIVAGRFDGEDSSGRRALTQQEPAEVVERAVTIAELMIAKLRERGHVALMPALTPSED